MLSTLRRTIFVTGLAVGGFGAVIVTGSGAAVAQEGAPPPPHRRQTNEQSPEGGAGMPGVDVDESEAGGIINWWSFDYGSAAKDSTHKGWPPPFGFALVNFAIFLGIMSKLLWKPLQKMAAERSHGIAKSLDSATELHKKAEAQLKTFEAKVAGIDGEIETLLASIRKEAELEKARIIATAEADARRLKEDAERQIAAEIETARRELRRGVIEAAIAAAEAAVKQNIAADDQRKMAERYVADVEAQAKTSTSTGRPS
jgi:F-type H+-transporting ATPase subunit b